MTHLPKQDRLGWHHEAPFPPSLSPSLPQAHRFTPLATSPLREGVFGVWVIAAGVRGLRWVRGRENRARGLHAKARSSLLEDFH